VGESAGRENILENVCLGVQDTTSKIVEEACGAAMFCEFVGGLEVSYNMMLVGGGRGGVVLSGGQKPQSVKGRGRTLLSLFSIRSLFYKMIFFTD
jgi:hypothetical protein